MNLFKSKIEKAFEEVDDLGAKKLKHVRSGSLYDHLERVQKMLQIWECDEDTQLAGVYHSLYSTEYFKTILIDENKRSLQQKKWGERIEKLVYIFSVMDRESIEYVIEKNSFKLKKYADKDILECNFEDGLSLIHVMLANDVDHLGTVEIGLRVEVYKKYKDLRKFFNNKAKNELDKLVNFEEKKEDKEGGTFIRFIAHSGVQISDGMTSVVVDPWLYDSKRNSPIIESLDPTQRTIDYLIPEPKNNVSDLSPDVVCLSHFHTHHSPLREIIEFAKIKNIKVICPPLTPSSLTILKQKIGDYIFSRIEFLFVETDKTFTINGATIKAMVHRKNFIHVMYHISLNDKSLIHVVDAVADIHNIKQLSFSSEWNRIYNTRPNFLFVGAAGHILRTIKNGERILEEAASLTPTQAAELASFVMPKQAGIIGIYNHSVWDSRYEMAMSSGEAEDHFYWGLSYLAPSIKVKKLLPGDIFY